MKTTAPLKNHTANGEQTCDARQDNQHVDPTVQGSSIRIELKEIPAAFQRTIENNLNIRRAANVSAAMKKK